MVKAGRWQEMTPSWIERMDHLTLLGMKYGWGPSIFSLSVSTGMMTFWSDYWLVSSSLQRVRLRLSQSGRDGDFPLGDRHSRVGSNFLLAVSNFPDSQPCMGMMASYWQACFLSARIMSKPVRKVVMILVACPTHSSIIPDCSILDHATFATASPILTTDVSPLHQHIL